MQENSKKIYTSLSSYYLKNGEFYTDNVIEHNGCYLTRNMQSLRMPKIVVDDWAKLLLSETELIDETYKEVLDINSMDHKLFIKTAFIFGQALAFYADNDIMYFAPLNYDMVNGVLVIEYDKYEYKIVEQNNRWFVNKYEKETGKLSKSWKLNYKPYEILIFQNDIEFSQGKSVFYDAIDVIEQIDLTYTDMNDERDMSKPMIVASEETFETSIEVPDDVEDKNPEQVKEAIKYTTWMPKSKRIFKGLKGNLDKIPLQKFTFDMQNDKYAEQLDLHLSIFSKICKLGNDYYSFNKLTKQVEKTATAVIDKQGDLASSLADFRLAYKQFLKQFYKNVFGQELDDNFIMFGDGIYRNDQYERDINLKEIVELQIPELEIEYLVRWLGYEHEEAERIVNSRTDNETDGIKGIHQQSGEETDTKED